MSISYPLRTARFCSAIFMASRSVILRLTILMASFWLMPRMCMVTRIFPSVSINSAKMRSWILRGGDLQKADCPVHLADAEGAGLPEVEGGRGDEVLDRKAAGRQPVPIEGEPSALRVKNAVKQLQPLFPVQHMGGGPHDLEAVEGVGLDTGKPRPRRRQVLRSMVRVTYLVFT